MTLTDISKSFESNIEKYEKISKSIQEILKKFGLTQNESKIYIYLSKNGAKKAIEIAKNQKIPRTETYHLLSALQNKGIVTATFDRPTKFEGIEFEKAINILISNEQKRVEELQLLKIDLRKLWKEIPSLNEEINSEKENCFQILQGKAVLNKLEDLTKNAKEELLILGTNDDFLKLYHSNFFNYLKKSKAGIRILTTRDEKNTYVFEEIPHEKIKIIPEHGNQNLYFLIKDGNEIVFFMSNNGKSDASMIAVWTDSSALVSSFQILFNLFWSKINSTKIANDMTKEELKQLYQHGIKELNQEKVLLEVLNRKITKTK